MYGTKLHTVVLLVPGRWDIHRFCDIWKHNNNSVNGEMTASSKGNNQPSSGQMVEQLSSWAVEQLSSQAVEQLSSWAVEQSSSQAVKQLSGQVVEQSSGQAVEWLSGRTAEQSNSQEVEQSSGLAVKQLSSQAVEQLSSQTVEWSNIRAVMQSSSWVPMSTALSGITIIICEQCMGDGNSITGHKTPISIAGSLLDVDAVGMVPIWYLVLVQLIACHLWHGMPAPSSEADESLILVRSALF